MIHTHRYAVIGVAFQQPQRITQTTYDRQRAQHGMSTITERCVKCPAVRSYTKTGRVVVPEVATVLI